MSLQIVDGIKFPDSLVTEVAAWIGRRGSGKTYGATKAAEEMHRIGAQFVALDSVGVWYGLRQPADGQAKGLNVPIFGGLKGDAITECCLGHLRCQHLDSSPGPLLIRNRPEYPSASLHWPQAL